MTRASIWTIATGLAAGLILHAVAWPAKKTAKQFLNPDGKKPPGYTQLVKSPPGTMIFISGQGGADADGKMPGDFTSQVRNTFESVKKCLAMAGATFKDIVKINYYVTDIGNAQ